MLRILITLFFFTSLLIRLNAQEVFKPLEYNTKQQFYKTTQKQFSHRSYRSTPDLETPFFDDFSWSNVVPADSLWVDQYVFINNNMAIMPPSIGFATFDGLNEHGMPYNPGVSDSKGKKADKLTSIPLNLSKYKPADSIYLSFFYQPAGLGNAPQGYDSLVLEVKPDSFWNGNTWDTAAWMRIWSAPGSQLQPFKQVILHIPEQLKNNGVILGNLYHSSFQFRFLNYANLSGNMDLWHIDYVYLAKGRSINDIYFEDLAVVYDPPSLLREYNSVPWKHLKNNTNQIRNDLDIIVRNMYNDALKARGGYELIDTFDNDQILFNDNANSQDIFTVREFVLASNIRSEIKLNDVTEADRFALEYSIVNFNNTNDDHLSNNRATRYQVFDNYYAYDDGDAELGYGVSNSNASKVAYKYSMLNNYPKTDSLRGVLIYFNQSNDNVSQLPFSIHIWKNKEDKPIYTLETNVPLFENSLPNVFYFYEFDTVLSLEGDFHIGWEQFSDFHLNVGLDLNYFRITGDTLPTKANPNLFYYVRNKWNPSSAKGALMMRPVFSETPISLATKKKKQSRYNTKIYPNPANNILMIDGIVGSSNIFIFDAQGKQVLNQELHASGQLNIEHLQSGFYLLTIVDTKLNKISKHKLIIKK